MIALPIQVNLCRGRHACLLCHCWLLEPDTEWAPVHMCWINSVFVYLPSHRPERNASLHFEYSKIAWCIVFLWASGFKTVVCQQQLCVFFFFFSFVFAFCYVCFLYTSRTMVGDVYQWISKCDVQTSSISSTWELARNVNSQATLQTYWLRNSGGGARTCFNKPVGWLWHVLKFENQNDWHV